MSADIPEQVVDIDITKPPPPPTLLAQLVPTEGLRAALRSQLRSRHPLVDDAVQSQRATSAAPTDDRTRARLGPVDRSGSRRSTGTAELCATVPADGNLLGVLLDYARRRSVQGPRRHLLRRVAARRRRGCGPDARSVRGEESARAARASRPTCRRTTTRRSTGVDVRLADGSTSVAAARSAAACDQSRSPLVVAPSRRSGFDAVEPDGAREDVRRADGRRHVAHVHREPDVPVARAGGQLLERPHRWSARCVRQSGAAVHRLDRAAREGSRRGRPTSRSGSSSATSDSACTWYESVRARRAVTSWQASQRPRTCTSTWRCLTARGALSRDANGELDLGQALDAAALGADEVRMRAAS